MKCAKCGNEISPDEMDCPYCSGAKDPPATVEGEDQPGANSGTDDRMMLFCPRCGSRNIRIENGDYSLGWGCLGTLLFGWVGLLLGLLGMGDSKAICRNCGYVAPLNRSQASCSGCGCLIIIVILIIALMMMI